MRCFENGMTAHIVDIATRRYADAANLGGQRVREVITIEIHRRDDIKFIRTRQDLLQCDVGDRILDEDLAAFESRILLGIGSVTAFSALVRSH